MPFFTTPPSRPIGALHGSRSTLHQLSLPTPAVTNGAVSLADDATFTSSRPSPAISQKPSGFWLYHFRTWCWKGIRRGGYPWTSSRTRELGCERQSTCRRHWRLSRNGRKNLWPTSRVSSRWIPSLSAESSFQPHGVFQFPGAFLASAKLIMKTLM